MASSAITDTMPLETPFLEVYDGAPASEASADQQIVETPFLTEHFVGEEVVSESSPAWGELLADLYDSEFDEALHSLVDEADERAQLLGLDEANVDPARVERALTQWIEPLRMETEALLDGMAEALDGADAGSMSSSELEELLDRFEPRGSPEGPVFEDFLKKIWSKAKSAVRGAVSLAKKGIAAVGKIVPLSMILDKLKALVRPLLTRVLRLAMNQLPPALRPAAATLAKRFLGVGEIEGQLDELADESEAASADVRALQLELDSAVGALMLAAGEPEMEALVAEHAIESERSADAPLTQLDSARERFVNGLAELREGEDPTPLVEEFVPAVLGALRLGIRVIGRPKVVRFLAQYLGRLIQPYVGPQVTPPLSQAIVDAGLRLMTLEAGKGESERNPSVAAEAFAALVEDAVTHVTELGEDELDEEGLVEEVAFEGFHRAARTHFPPRVLRRPTGRPAGVWVNMPRRGPWRFRKYSRVFDITISPEAAALIRTRGGRTLATFLRDRFSDTGPVRARIHLYQAIPGTRLARIVHAERAVPGLGSSARAATAELHPLTREAAGALVGQPELGEDVGEAYLDELAPAAVGQRFYFLEIPGGRPAATVNSAGARVATGMTRPRLSGTHVAVDLARGELRVTVHLAEAQAQDISARLRRNEPLGASLAALRAIYARGLQSLGAAGAHRRVRIIGETSGEALEDQLVRPSSLPGVSVSVGDVLAQWTRRALAARLRAHRDAFVAAAAAPQDGVTLRLTYTLVPGLRTIARLLRGRAGIDPRDLRALASLRQTVPGAAQLDVNPGYHRG